MKNVANFVQLPAWTLSSLILGLSISHGFASDRGVEVVQPIEILSWTSDFPVENAESVGIRNRHDWQNGSTTATFTSGCL